MGDGHKWAESRSEDIDDWEQSKNADHKKIQDRVDDLKELRDEASFTKAEFAQLDLAIKVLEEKLLGNRWGDEARLR